MKEFRVGSVDKRELCVRFYRERHVWWAFWCRRYAGMTHRCYCDAGSFFDGRIVVLGFGMSWFYSNYTGDVPCSCERAIEECRVGG